METFPNNNDPGYTENDPDTSSHPGGVVNDGNGKNLKQDSAYWSKTGGVPVPHSTEENHENNPDTSSHPGGVVNYGNGKNPKDSAYWSKTGGVPVPYSTEENHEDDPANMDAPF